ncbi:hypothetical protein [Pseudosulfitobacter koreensis]|uniref:Tryptophan-rich sensory protein n=1 Tax=Pseudosulfitobacter koreensis TaxID=2968472 RepID=A0ABT1Z4E6_9RHOB|nr:hypothetical protein [Pseudosulfitobacter koreense]MCR8828007.1 hypothetical protein [Pseudosulfitobacter koreense]
MDGLGIIIQGISILVVLLSLGPTFWHGHQCKRSNPEKMGSRWGYFVTYSTALFYIFVLGGLTVLWLVNNGFAAPQVYMVILLVFITGISYLAMRRNRWALIAITFLSLNPLWMIINLFYFGNRWSEFKVEALEKRAEKTA